MTISPSRREVFLGVDVGTQGARALALDDRGAVVASARSPFPLTGPDEQSPELWWSAVVTCLRTVVASLAENPNLLPVALSVTSTSGTVIPLNAEFAPWHQALMYSDKRSASEANEINALAPALGCNPSWGLPKIVWFARTHPEKAAHIRHWRHAGDFILGRLTGEWGMTDVTNALKSGYDLVAQQWPSELFDQLGLDPAWFPRVVPSGHVLGRLTSQVARETGLPASIVVATGMTDGCASQIASGAARPGDWSTTLGTTMVVKGVTQRRIEDPLGRIYNHLHPDGFWMPGGASNTGAEWIARDYGGQDLDALERSARIATPTGLAAYPLRQNGERFPFRSPSARGFDPPGANGGELYAARLEGVAFLERMAFELVEDLSGEPVQKVFTAGGGSRSDLWTQIRADVLGKPIHRARNTEGAAGAATLAAAAVRYDRLGDAAAALTTIESTIEPDRSARRYDDGYHSFLAAIRLRGDIP